MSDIIVLAAEQRERAGKGVARALRREGLVPAVIYGGKEAPEGISVNSRDITKIFNTGRLLSTLIEIEVKGKKQRAIARDVQLHPVRDDILHADFLRLGKDAKIAVEVAVNFLNEETCPGLKMGGVLNVVRYTIELNCPADNIPEAIDLDLAEAQMNDSIHISEVNLPDGVEPVITDRDFTIVTIAAPAALRSEAEDEAEAAEAEAEAAEGEAEEGGEE
ncbi:MAG: 50S ribosomal protein L25/general stress protein Ctc [Rhodobiaceae bacterium]|nr:50S ribosomal protein L25/general stress protein Ctc [Rhodobiaceae bacterium]MBT5517967.1 50S ribosomal protein L25/general stress protein Ctc [Rhodobiaceae bacterium]MBT7280030.1 50S ribosomal protein L25/general stress protein Ctc [Rhodobiaceae bacterium]